MVWINWWRILFYGIAVINICFAGTTFGRRQAASEFCATDKECVEKNCCSKSKAPIRLCSDGKSTSGPSGQCAWSIETGTCAEKWDVCSTDVVM